MESYTYQAKFYLQKRYLVALMAFFGWIFMFLMRTNLSICMVDMTSERLLKVDNETIIQAAEFQWSSKEKGVILSAFSWGYMTAPFGALAAAKFGGVKTFGAGIALTGLLTMLSPILMSWSLEAYLVARILEGVFEAAAASSFVEALRLWSTSGERNRLIAGSNSGCVFGIMLGYPICGTVAYYFDWKAVFYVTGGIPLLWAVIWFALIRNSPEEDNLMTVHEKRHLRQSNEMNTDKKVLCPWTQVLKSKPVWAFWNNRFAEAWSVSFIIYSLPIYIKDIHNVDIQKIGLISGIPHSCAAVSIIGGSIAADFLRNNGLLSISNVHKLYLTFAQIVAIILLSTIALWRNFLVNILCFCLYRLFFTVCTVSHDVLPVDMGGQYACIISGIGTTALGLGYSLSTLVMGLIVTHHSTAEWSIYFAVLSIFSLWGGLVFFFFGSGELQPWAVSSEDIVEAEKGNVSDEK